MLDAWLAWARRCQIPTFVDLYHRIKKHRAGIIASVTHGLSNGLTESEHQAAAPDSDGLRGSAPTTSSPSASSTEAARLSR